MTEAELSARPPVIRHHPQWQAWVVVALAAVSVLLCGAYIEAAVRQGVRETIRREPKDWSDPQVRLFATAQSNLSFKARARLLREVVAMKPSGLITAAAARDLGTFGRDEAERLHYTLLAAKSAPPDSLTFAVYRAMAAMTLEDKGRIQEGEALLRDGIQRATLARGQVIMLGRLLSIVDEHEGVDAMLRTYTAYEYKLPSIAHDDGVQQTLAYHLEDAHRQRDADRIWRYLVANASNEKTRANARKALSKGGSDGH